MAKRRKIEDPAAAWADVPGVLDEGSGKGNYPQAQSQGLRDVLAVSAEQNEDPVLAALEQGRNVAAAAGNSPVSGGQMAQEFMAQPVEARNAPQMSGVPPEMVIDRESAAIVYRMDPERLKKAQADLQEYKAAKVNLEQRIVENERWYKMRHWEQVRVKSGDPEPASAWLFNSLANKHADAMDSYPRPVVLPREMSDRNAAERLTDILPVVLERAEFEETYDRAWWYKLKHGTACYGVYWDAKAENGLGDISVRLLDLLNIFWEPGIDDIQQSRNLFVTEMCDDEELQAKYPQLKGKLGGSSIDVAKYIYDENISTIGKSVVVDWYYKIDRGNGAKLHLCKFVGDTVLYCSEEDPAMADGWYDHGKYPVVFDVLFPDAGMPAGFGYVDIMKDTQMYIDKVRQGVLKSSVIASKPRYFVRDGIGMNEEEYADLTKDFVHTSGQVDGESLRQIDPPQMPGYVLDVLQMEIDQLKETSGNRDFSQGGTTSGVTAASAIAALQEAGSKLSRDMLKGGYRAFREINYLCIELMRQFYAEVRYFRVTGSDGEKFVPFDNRGMRMQQVSAGGLMTERLPIFDVQVTAQRANPFSTLAQNEMAKEMFGMGMFNPGLAEQSLAALELMDFEGKDSVKRKIEENGSLMQQMQMMQAQMQKMAMIIDRQNGTTIGEGMMKEGVGGAQ